MTPDDAAPPRPAAAPPPSGKRLKKRRAHGHHWYLRHVWIVAVLAAAVAAVLAIRVISHIQPRAPIEGYIDNVETLRQEFARFEGRPLQNLGVEQQFQQAAALMASGDYAGAAVLLDDVSKVCAVPAVFHDLGLICARTGDPAHALKSLREALARDPDYRPTRAVLTGANGYPPTAGLPTTTETEPNNDYTTANLLWLGVPVKGEISTAQDVDYFRVSAPRAPRDVLRIELANRSTTLTPRITVFDASGRAAGEVAEAKPGASATLRVAPMPNTTMYIEITGAGTTGGYTLTVTAAKAFDHYEPNEDLNSAARIEIGQLVEANIMTGDDKDFYFFRAPHAGTMVVSLQSQTAGLIPALTVYNGDRQAILTSYKEQTPSLAVTVNVQADEVYFLNVTGQLKTTGAYTLVVQAKK